LRGRGIAFFHNSHDVAFAPDNPAIPERAVHNGCDDGGCGLRATVSLHECLECATGEKRHIARQQHKSARSAIQVGLGLLQGMRGPELWLLDGERQPRVSTEVGLDVFGLMTHNDCGCRRRDGGCRVENVFYQRPACHLMEDFGLGRLHSGPLPGGQDHDVGL